MDHAAHERYAAEGAANKGESIKITDEWYDELQKMPFKSSKCLTLLLSKFYFILAKRGKTLILLKESSKPIPKKK